MQKSFQSISLISYDSRVAQLEERHGIMKLRDMFMKYDLRSVCLGDTDSMKVSSYFITSLPLWLNYIGYPASTGLN